VTAQARVRAAALVAAQVAAPETEQVRAPVTAQAQVRAPALVAETVWARAAVLERVQARVVVRAAVGRGLPTHTAWSSTAGSFEDEAIDDAANRALVGTDHCPFLV
jgi:hypothetical protein